MLANQLRSFLRQQLWWIKFQELNREGWRDAYIRRRIQNQILATPPLHTDTEGDIEVRALTWRRDWKNLIWALKSFYHYAGQSYPLYIHDGGLTAEGTAALHRHFPNARIIPQNEADTQVNRIFTERGLSRCLAYRKKNRTTLKLFDFFALSQARTMFSIDSDIVFFREPRELLTGDPGKNVYNRDAAFWYSMTLDELEARFGLRPPSHINSGLARIDRRSIDFDAVENWLAEPKLFEDDWVTEQTLHALCSARYGVELLPPTYAVSTERGMPENVVCKHYPGNKRPLLYQEGMRKLRDSGFFASFAQSATAPRRPVVLAR